MSARKLSMIVYRLCWAAFVVLVLIQSTAELPFDQWLLWLPAGCACALAIWLGRCTAHHLRVATPAAVEVAVPVAGRWTALNSPANRVPSHGVHAFGQSYATDVIGEPEPGTRPTFRWLWPIARRNGAFPGYGAPVLAAAEGTVVRVRPEARPSQPRFAPGAAVPDAPGEPDPGHGGSRLGHR